jgi:hypothetical protein
MPSKDIEEVKEKVCEWMKGRGIFIRETESEETDFQLEGKTEVQVGITIVKPKKLYKSLIVISKLELHPGHFAKFDSLNSKKKAEFIWDLKKDLIFVPATFTIEQSGDNLKSIQFAKEISFDELTEGRLIEAVDSVCRPLIWTAWVFVKRFGQPENAL